MKKIQCIIVALWLLTGCQNASISQLMNQQQIVVTPSSLHLQGNSVNFTLMVTLPPSMTKKNYTYTFTPSYVYGDQQKVNFEPLVFELQDGQKKQTNVIEKKYTFACTPAMSKGTVQVTGSIINNNGKKIAETSIDAAVGIITTSRLAKVPYDIHYVTLGALDPPQPTMLHTTAYFEKGNATLAKTGKKEIDKLFQSPKIIDQITITGFHSPEGPKHINTSLVINRAKKVNHYCRKNLKKLGYSHNIDLMHQVNDWTLFQNILLNNEQFTQADKQEVLTILNQAQNHDFEQTEKKLGQLSIYKKLQQYLYPTLRRVDISLSYTPKEQSKDDLMKEVHQFLENEKNIATTTLSDKALIRAAHLASSLEKKEQILYKAVSKTPNWFTYNNLGAVYLEQAIQTTKKEEKNILLNKAKKALVTSIQYKQSNEALVNQAIIAYLQGDYVYVKQLLETMDSTQEQDIYFKSIQGALWIHLGQYQKALEILKQTKEAPENSFNKGIALLLLKQYDQANESLNTTLAHIPNYAAAYYAKAIIEARKKNTVQMKKHLEKAHTYQFEHPYGSINDLEIPKIDATVQNIAK